MKTAQIPAKADTEAQVEFLDFELQPRIDDAKANERQLLFVDASHFVLAAFLGYLWSFTRIFVKSPSGRQRYNVLGAFNAVSHELFTVTNNAYINANSIISLMTKLLENYADKAITLVMDNARYQRCALVMDFAKQNGIELLFLPAYSPNLNLIERLWKFVKKTCLYSKYYADFDSFKFAIDDCLANLNSIYQSNISSLMSLKFQLFHNVS